MSRPDPRRGQRPARNTAAPSAEYRGALGSDFPRHGARARCGQAGRARSLGNSGSPREQQPLPRAGCHHDFPSNQGRGDQQGLGGPPVRRPDAGVAGRPARCSRSPGPSSPPVSTTPRRKTSAPLRASSWRGMTGVCPPTWRRCWPCRASGARPPTLSATSDSACPGICVDTHVHRISNRMGWVHTHTPDQTEQALMDVLPRRYWIGVNEILVRYGQAVCTPLSPRCSSCPAARWCPRAGVGRTR